MSTTRLIEIEQRIRLLNQSCNEIDDQIDAHFNATQQKKSKGWLESYDAWCDRTHKLDIADQNYCNNKSAMKQSMRAEIAHLEAERKRLNDSQFGGLDTAPL